MIEKKWFWGRTNGEEGAKVIRESALPPAGRTIEASYINTGCFPNQSKYIFACIDNTMQKPAEFYVFIN